MRNSHGCGSLLHGLHVHRLVYHPADLAVTAKRQPADSIFSLPILRFREYPGEPFPLGTEQLGAAGIEEKKEFIHPDPEQLREREVPELVDDNKYRKRKNDLQNLHQNNHHQPFLAMPSIFLWANEYISSFVLNMSSTDGSFMNGVHSMHSPTMSVIQ